MKPLLESFKLEYQTKLYLKVTQTGIFWIIDKNLWFKPTNKRLDSAFISWN